MIFALEEAGKPAFLSTDEDGTFVLSGLGFGDFKLEARAAANDGTPLSSRAVSISLSKASPTATVRITVEPSRAVQGVVLAGATPVAGADIVARFLGNTTDVVLLAPSAQSDASGRFTLDVPPGVERLELFTMAPGFTFDRSEFVLQAEVDITVPLDTASGVLRLTFDHPSQPRAQNPTLIHDGQFPYALNLLARWASRNGIPPRGGEWVLPQMPPEAYTLCAQTENGERPCREGYLPPGGDVTLMSTVDVETQPNQ